LAGKYVFQSAYAYADNNPINKMDYNGEGTEEGGGQSTQGQASGTTAETHQVKKGETLSGIAKQHGITVDALRKANNLDPKNDTKLQIGTKLNIPQTSTQNQGSSNFKFNFDTILADNARSFMPTPLGLNTPKPGSSGGWQGQFNRFITGDTYGEYSGSQSAQTGLPGGVVQIGGTLAGFNLSFLGGFSQIDGFNGGISYGGDLNWDDWGVGLTIMGSDRLFKWDDVKGLGTTASIGYSVASYTESFSGLPTLENRNQSIYLFQGVTWGLGTRFGASLSVTKTKLVR
jgi:LysM repeat protein